MASVFRVAIVLAALWPAPAAHAADMAGLSSFGAFGSGPGQFDHPLGATVGANGNVWVVDALNDRVTEWTGNGGFIRAFGSTGSDRGQFRLPEDVDIAEGFLYVSDCYGQRVQRIDLANFVSAGEFTGGPTRFTCPEGLEAISGTEVYVADTFNDRIVVYNPSTRTVIKTFTTSLPRPRDVAVNQATGDVYVTVGADDQCVASRVARLSADGTVLGTFGTSGAGKLFCPLGVEVDEAGNVIVSDAGGRVNVYTATGELAMSLTPPPGTLSFRYPYGLATDAQCRIYVAERDVPRVDVYGFTEAPFCRTLPAAADVKPPAAVTKDKAGPAMAVAFPKSVSLTKASTVSLKVRCPFEACTVRAFGKVRVSGKVRWWMQIVKVRRFKAGVQGTVKLRFRKSADLAAVRRAVRRGAKPKLELVVSASDAKGNFARKRVERAVR